MKGQNRGGERNERFWSASRHGAPVSEEEPQHGPRDEREGAKGPFLMETFDRVGFWTELKEETAARPRWALARANIIAQRMRR